MVFDRAAGEHIRCRRKYNVKHVHRTAVKHVSMERQPEHMIHPCACLRGVSTCEWQSEIYAGQGQCAASPAPKAAKTPSKTPSKRILQGMEAREMQIHVILSRI